MKMQKNEWGGNARIRNTTKRVPLLAKDIITDETCHRFSYHSPFELILNIHDSE